MKKISAVSLLLILLTSACQSATDQTPVRPSEPTAQPSPTPIESLFFDDFSGQTLDWIAFGQNNDLPTLSDGAAHFLLTVKNKATAAATGTIFPEDVIVESDVNISSDASMNAFGVFCRYNSAQNMAYLFYVAKYSADTARFAGLSIYDLNSLQTRDLFKQPLEGDLATASSLHLQAKCIGPHLELSINGQSISYINESSLTGGDAGMFAFGDGVSGEIQFDNFAVLPVSPDQSAAARLPTPKSQ